jgi:hypothetical protein
MAVLTDKITDKNLPKSIKPVQKGGKAKREGKKTVCQTIRIILLNI